jgi:serine/threonine protein kinase
MSLTSEMITEHCYVLRRSGVHAQLWFARNESGLSDSSNESTEDECVNKAVMKKCYYPSMEVAQEHAEILESIVSINVSCIKQFEIPPFCITDIICTSKDIIYFMPRYDCTLEEWMCENSMEHTSTDPYGTLQQITDGMEKLHALSLIHLDLKPDNILMNLGPTPRVFIADFETCTRIITQKTGGDNELYTTQKTYHGSPAYSAPEHLLQNVCKASDVWSFGCIALRLCTGLAQLWPTDMGILQVFHTVCRFCKTPYDELTPDVLRKAEEFNNGSNVELLRLLRDHILRHSVHERMTFADISTFLKHR